MSKTRLFAFFALVCFAGARPAHAANSIVVESRTFEVGQTACSLGIWLTNDVDISGLVMPIEARGASGGAFYLAGNPLTRPNLRPGSRVDMSPLGSADPGGNWPAANVTSTRYAAPSGTSCGGPVSNTYQTPAGSVDAISPDGWLYAVVSSGNEGGPDFDSIALAPGADAPVRDSASFVFIFNANSVIGCFEIDSCCVRPANHVSLYDRTLNQLVGVEFTKGEVCIGSDVNQPPVINCPSSISQQEDFGEEGAIVNYSVTYTDEDTTLVPDCNPPPGSFFPTGMTIVTCIVTDTLGLADTCTFPVTVTNNAPGNSITIESRNFEIGQTACSLGIWLNNDVHVTGLVLMIEARAVSGGAFYLAGNSLTRPNRQASGRLHNSPLGAAGPNWPAANTTNNRYPTPGGAPCSGPISNTYQTPAAAIDAVPPDGWLFSCVATGDGNFGQDVDLDPGTDSPTRDSASWVFIFDANNSIGCFEIDTCCVRPAGHTSMVDLNTNLVPVDFAKGMICLEADVNQAPTLNCPSSITQAKDPGQGGAVVNYNVSYFDEDLTLTPVCAPPSGSFFPIGTTLVTCTVTDTFGLADTCEFPVTVVDAEGNRITVESETFFINQTACTVDVSLANVIPIEGLVIPLDIRSTSGGAFYETPSGPPFFARRSGGRLDLSPLGSADPGGDWPAASTTMNYFDNTQGPACGTRTYGNATATVGGTSPDAVLFAAISTGDPGMGDEIALQPGVDPANGQSWHFVFEANGSIGCFEIDTCCVRPSSHLSFLDDGGNTQPVGFTKGTICLELNTNENYPPEITCPLVEFQSVDGSGTGAVVNFTVDVSDEDPNLEAVSTPASGSFFPLGTTLVTSIATDTAGLADTCSFNVVVHNADADEVVIESKTFAIGQSSCSVGVFLENTTEVTGLVLPLETRTLTNGVYFKSNPLSRPTKQVGRRLDLSPLGSADPGGLWPASSTSNNRYPNPGGTPCGGPISNTYQTPAAGINFISPDGFLYATVSTGDENLGQLIALLPGADPRRTDSASWLFVFDMDTIEGCFEIDTMCVRPSGHLSWSDLATQQITPSFTKGVICVSNCICDCHANPAACSDPAVNILDVLYTVNVAFRGFAEIDDNNPLCPINATDVNCDGVSSVIDVIKMVDVAFRAGDPAAVFCDPCP